MEESKSASERRNFIRLDYTTPIAYKVCKEETISKLLEGYTANISQSGILCRIKDKVQPDDLLWISFDRATLTICEDLESRAFIYQNGIIGKVVRIEPGEAEEYSVGVQFLTRQEKDLTHIHPKLYFITKAKEGKDA